MEDTIKRSDAIKAIVNTPSNIADVMGNNLCLDGAVFRQNEIIDILKDIPSAENQGENATRCYEFLKTKLGEGIVDSKKEFESWYERMVWHVKECDKLAREPKHGEWIHDRLEADGAKLPDLFLPLCQCSECSIYVQYESNFCPNCGARMKGADDE